MARPRLVRAGVTLRDQLNKRFPNRDKKSDGWIGDVRHQKNKGWGTNGKGSYHNPDPDGWVHAIDVDENMGAPPFRNGATAKKFADELIAYCRQGLDGGRIAHVVYEDKVASGTHTDRRRFWRWRGSGYGHTHHIHISFTEKAEKDGSPFDLPIFKEKRTRNK